MDIEFTSFACICGETDLVAGPVPNGNTHRRVISEERIEIARSAFQLGHDSDKCVWVTKTFTLKVPSYLLAPPQLTPQG